MTYTAQIVDEIQTPTREWGILIECTCSTHKGNTRAIVRGNAVPVSHIHGLVLAAWHPFNLAGAASTRRFGPWAA